MMRVGLQETVRLRLRGGFRVNTREGDGKGDSPPIDKESEDDEGNRWWLRSNDSLILPAPLFFELDALINRVTLKKQNISHEKKKKNRQRTKSPGLA